MTAPQLAFYNAVKTKAFVGDKGVRLNNVSKPVIYCVLMLTSRRY